MEICQGKVRESCVSGNPVYGLYDHSCLSLRASDNMLREAQQQLSTLQRLKDEVDISHQLREEFDKRERDVLRSVVSSHICVLKLAYQSAFKKHHFYHGYTEVSCYMEHK